MGPTWAHLGPVGPRWAHVGPINLAIRAALRLRAHRIKNAWFRMNMLVWFAFRLTSIYVCMYFGRALLYIVLFLTVLIAYRPLNSSSMWHEFALLHYVLVFYVYLVSFSVTTGFIWPNFLLYGVPSWVWLPKCQWIDPEIICKFDQHQSTVKQNMAQTVCIIA